MRGCYVKLELIVTAGDPFFLFCFSSSLPSTPQAREELRPVREDFEAKNKQLLDEMPKFYHSRIDYFQPSFEALIRAQVSEPPGDVDTVRQHAHTHKTACSYASLVKVSDGRECIILAVCLPPHRPNTINPQ